MPLFSSSEQLSYMVFKYTAFSERLLGRKKRLIWVDERIIFSRGYRRRFLAGGGVETKMSPSWRTEKDIGKTGFGR